MRFTSSSFDYLVETVLILILFSNAVQAGRHRSSSTQRQPLPYRPATPRAVFDGVAQTQVIVAHGQPSPTHTTPLHLPDTNVEDRCQKISCFNEGDCARNDCGGYFCFHCETCSTGPVMGTCVWDRAQHQRNCPKKICNGASRSQASSQSNAGQTSGDASQGNKDDGNTLSTATATAGQASNKPWENSFQGLRLDNNKNGNSDKRREKDRRVGPN